MATSITVVLQQDVENLGIGGDVVKVKPGYARNYLLPRQLALPATAGNLTRINQLRKASEDRANQAKLDAVALKKKLESTSVKISRSVGAENKMYGSVTGKDIEEAYELVGIKIDRRKLTLPEPIRSLGLSEVQLKVCTEVTATLAIEVIKQTS